MLDVRGDMCDYTCVWELSVFFPVWSTHVYTRVSASPHFHGTVQLLAAAGSDNPSGNYSNIASIEK